MRLIACDPGLKGCLVLFINGDPTRRLDMPVTKDSELDMDALREWMANCKAEGFCMEAVQTRPGHAIQAALHTGWRAGMLIGLAKGLGLPTALVNAVTWSTTLAKAFQVSHLDPKDRSRFISNRLYPAQHINHKTKDGFTDALCIGFYYLWASGWIEHYKQGLHKKEPAKIPA